MPDMEGIEFLKTIRKLKKNLPVIVMSGNVMGRQFLTAARLFGATATLKKPFSHQDLMSTMLELL